jgi:hypothetical protein
MRQDLVSVVDGEINRAVSFGWLAPMNKYQPDAEMRNVRLVQPEKLERVDAGK